jgi:uncharacterized repeat protein (TIGR02543 family)
LIGFTGLQNGETIHHISAGNSHSLAVTTSGRVYAWGGNEYGYIGDGTTTDKTTPTLIAFSGLQNGETIQQVSASFRSFAVTTSGRVYAWGWNTFGSLGDGTTTQRNIPTLIGFTGLQNGETIHHISAGNSHSLAVTTSGRVYAWGGNMMGSLGDGTTTDKTTPTLIAFSGLQNGETIQQVSAGNVHSLAVTTTGRVYAWGWNTYGSLGDGTKTQRNIPTLIGFTGLLNGETIHQISAGRAHSLAVTTSGRVYAWGLAVFLGDGMFYSDLTYITTPKLLNNVIRPSDYLFENYLTITFNQPINLPDPTLEGYVFAGWFIDEALTIPYNLTTMPANDVMLYAKFTPVVD